MSKFAMAHAMKKRSKKMCHGGEYAEGGSVDELPDPDFVNEKEAKELYEADIPYIKEQNEKHKDDMDKGAKEQLMAKKMAEGGRVAKPTGDSGHSAGQDTSPYDQTMSNGWKNIKSELGMNDQKPKKMAAGGYASVKASHDAEMQAELDKYAKDLAPKKMAHGGMLTHDGYESECNEHCDHPGKPHPQASGYVDHEGDDVKHNHMAMKEDDDMIGRLMKKHMYSKGGMVANDTPDIADFEDNEFDDLVKDDHLESKQHDYGDHDGNKYGADHEDMISKVMMKRKKQHNPNPA